MINFLKKVLLISLAALFISSLFVASAEAANRKGSHRVGGTNSHGKGSRYEGGHLIKQVTPANFISHRIPSCPKYEMTKPLNCKDILL